MSFRLFPHLQQCVGRHPSHVNGVYPKNDSAYLLPLEAADRSAGGIIIAEAHREQSQKAIVLAVGNGLWHDEQMKLYPVECAVGDLVYLASKYAGVLVDVGGGLDVIAMRPIEQIGRKPHGTFQLVEHVIGQGTSREKAIYHEVGETCDHCPKPTSTLIEEERARLVAARNADTAAPSEDSTAGEIEHESAPLSPASEHAPSRAAGAEPLSRGTPSLWSRQAARRLGLA